MFINRRFIETMQQCKQNLVNAKTFDAVNDELIVLIDLIANDVETAELCKERLIAARDLSIRRSEQL